MREREGERERENVCVYVCVCVCVCVFVCVCVWAGRFVQHTYLRTCRFCQIRGICVWVFAVAYNVHVSISGAGNTQISSAAL